jgi:formylglycine-generating enzyme required for sulfatase activity
LLGLIASFFIFGFTYSLIRNHKAEKIEKGILENSRQFAKNNYSFEMVSVQGGTFQMGFSDDDKHMVRLSSFYLSKTEVTQAQWYAVMEYNPSEDRVWCISFYQYPVPGDRLPYFPELYFRFYIQFYILYHNQDKTRPPLEDSFSGSPD